MSNALEVRIPISPLDHYFNRVHLIAHSIRSLGGQYADTRIRVSVGADQEPEDLYKRLPWSRAAGVDWVWVDRTEFRRWEKTEHKYIATMMERFRPPFSARRVLMLDADVLVMRGFDELTALLDERPGVAAVMAYISPFKTSTLGHRSSWRLLFNLMKLPEPEFTHELSGWGTKESNPTWRFSPPYFNTGVLCASASALERLYDPYVSALDTVRGVMDSYYFEQIALTLALLQTGVPMHVLPVRYNFPNSPAFDARHPEELASVRFIHFLRTEIVRREADFETMSAVEKLAARDDLTGSNEMFRRRVADLLPLMKGAAASPLRDVG